MFHSLYDLLTDAPENSMSTLDEKCPKRYSKVFEEFYWPEMFLSLAF
jgi:hypothetical protein